MIDFLTDFYTESIPQYDHWTYTVGERYGKITTW